MPDMSGRPVELRPGKLPPQVRYRPVDDAIVVRGASLIDQLLLAVPAKDPQPLLGDVVMLNPGAWKYLADESALKRAKPLVASLSVGHRTVHLEGRFLQRPEEMATAVENVRKLIAADGGATIRALESKEMAQWWAFISLDIEEPVYVVETKRHSYRFIVGLLHDQLFLLDELNGLPPL